MKALRVVVVVISKGAMSGIETELPQNLIAEILRSKDRVNRPSADVGLISLTSHVLVSRHV